MTPRERKDLPWIRGGIRCGNGCHFRRGILAQWRGSIAEPSGGLKHSPKSLAITGQYGLYIGPCGLVTAACPGRCGARPH
jgi:hypothetical protein